MNTRIKLSKKQNILYKIIGICGCILELVSFILFILGKRNETNCKQYFIISLIFYCFIISCFIMIIIKPIRLEFLSLVSFAYFIIMIIKTPDDIFSCFMFIIGFLTLQIRGYFKRKKHLKCIILFSIYAILLCTEIRFGWKIFINSFLNTVAALFLFQVIFIFLHRYYTLNNNYTSVYICDFSDYEDQFSEQDKEIIRLLKEGQKYEWIAKHLNIATPTLKKKTHRIYTILNVPDLIGFLAQYSAPTIIFTKEELLEWKKNNISLL